MQPSSPSGEGDQQQPMQIERVHPKYWTGRAILTDLSLIVLAIISAFLEYIAYPSLLASPLQNSPQGEQNITLHILPLAFQYTAVRTYINAPAEKIIGVPFLDFFQLFLVLLVIVNILRYMEYRKK